MSSKTRTVAIIPARLASQRFPRKVLFPFYGLPMIEHVRRRALMCRALADVFVTTCDEEVAEVVRRQGGRVIMSSDSHRNGTDRVAEAISSIDCTHVIVLQGDEPLIVPEEVDGAVALIEENPDVQVWNATTPLTDPADIDNRSVVKCIVSPTGKILLMARRGPCVSDFEQQRQFIRKVNGFIAFKKETLKWIASAPATPFEVAESIEQSRLLENGIELRSIPFARTVPSVNLPEEAQEVAAWLETDTRQKQILKQVLENNARIAADVMP